jgi:hypothetical protein
VRPSEAFRTLYPVFCTVVFKETTRTVHTRASFSLFSSIESSKREKATSFSESDGVGSRQNLPSFYWRKNKSIRPSSLVFDVATCLILCRWISSTILCKVNSLFCVSFHHENLALSSNFSHSSYLVIGEPQLKWTARNEKNWMKANHWSSPKQGGSQKQQLCSVKPEETLVVWISSSPGKRSVARKPLADISPFAVSSMHFQIIHQFGTRWRLALGLHEVIFQFRGGRMFSALSPRVAFCCCCAVGGKWCEHDSLELKVLPSRFLLCE